MRSEALSLWSIAVMLQSFTISVNAAQVYLCGDSTMAKGKQPIEGWGEYFQPLVSIEVHNRAVGGRSARSFTSERRFEDAARVIQPGDTVIIEFGRNDGGLLKNDTLSGTPCPGGATETCEITINGHKETVLTFAMYLTNAGKSMTEKGANVIFSSMLPHNIWWTRQGGKQNLNPPPPKFVEYAKTAASMVGEGASYVDHWASTVEMYKKMGKAKVDSFFPREGDPVHTNTAGAKAVAKAFVMAVQEAKNPFNHFVV